MPDNLNVQNIDWHNVLTRLGVDAQHIVNPKKRGPCPIEGTGQTRFRFDNKGNRGTWVCNCGAGDGIKFVALLTQKSNAEAIRLIMEMTQGHSTSCFTKNQFVEPKKTLVQIEKNRKFLKATWDASREIAGTPAWWYLQSRVQGLKIEWVSKNFRYHPSLFHIDNEDNNRKSRHPGLVSRVVDAANPVVVTLHRTYLNHYGSKALVSPSQVKKVMSSTVDKLRGESIKVNNANSAFIIVAEGIESALAWVAATKNKYAVFAALNCFSLGQFSWPAETKGILIAGDNDLPNPKTGRRPGMHYAYILRDRALEFGLKVKTVFPSKEGIDFDELWNEGKIEEFSLR